MYVLLKKKMHHFLLNTMTIMEILTFPTSFVCQAKISLRCQVITWCSNGALLSRQKKMKNVPLVKILYFCNVIGFSILIFNTNATFVYD